ncbi:TRAP transporter small permease [Ahrensia sp. R2A130]|uniref:TRAP transporter small permease n=1 Tax=Ahrensia sp. R2A130 TaxID=744979 RepID=UPI0001E0D8C8|nr:TRAP transporter small permease subunit [Ahrensia sp. R2A130]EFL87534.1 tripartite ATP-independent periplasmic transporter DctQ [Ahrensia sp. R2A130]
MTSFWPSFWNGFDRLLNALAFIAGLIIPIMFVSIIYDVTTRSLRIFQITWAVAITEYALLYLSCLGAPWLLREKGHVSMEAFRTIMPPGFARVVEIVVMILCMVACAVVATVALPVMVQNFGVTDIRANFLQRWLLYVPVVLCFALCAVQFARTLLSGGSLYKGVTASNESL